MLSSSVSASPCRDSIAFFTRTARHRQWITSVTGRGPLTATAPPETDPTTSGDSGYWLLESDGDVTAFGSARALGGAELEPGATAVAIAARPQGDGYWVLASDGDLVAAGGAVDYGGVDPAVLTRPGEVVSAVSASPDGSASPR